MPPEILLPPLFFSIGFDEGWGTLQEDWEPKLRHQRGRIPANFFPHSFFSLNAFLTWGGWVPGQLILDWSVQSFETVDQTDFWEKWVSGWPNLLEVVGGRSGTSTCSWLKLVYGKSGSQVTWPAKGHGWWVGWINLFAQVYKYWSGLILMYWTLIFCR